MFGFQSSQEVLERARKWALSSTAKLPDFVCTQITRRSDNQGRGDTALKKRHDIATKVQFEGNTHRLPLRSTDILVGRRGSINQNKNKWVNYRPFASKTTLDFGK